MITALRTFALTIALWCLPGSAFAQTVPRTNVSGHGVDSGNCSAASPCRTFAYAFTETMAGGEIDALDAADYGTVVITRPISINGTGYTTGISVPKGGTGILIQGVTVSLRGLSIDGHDFGGSDGIVFQGGYAIIQDCVIQRLSIGILEASGVFFLEHSTISDNEIGINGINSSNRIYSKLSRNIITRNQIGIYHGNYNTFADNIVQFNYHRQDVDTNLSPDKNGFE